MTKRFLHAFERLDDSVVAEILTNKLSDESYEGVWSRVRDPIYIFADHNMDGTKMTHHGGTIAGTATGVPVQLLFWGSWWNGPGSGMKGEIIAQTHRLLASRYFTQLVQYGIPRAPVWRGAMTVISPGPPMSGSGTETMRATLDMVDDLLDDDVFPDPDDGPRIAFVVLLPDGYVVTDGGLGAHWHDYDFDGPFDSDEYWAGWVRLADAGGSAPDETVVTVAHEIAEIVTDPEGDGWHTEVNSGANEIVDAGQSPRPGNTPWTANATDQTAYTDDVKLQAYWSNAHGRTVIPVNEGYAARLRVKLRETSRRTLGEGTFRPGKGGLSFCIADRDYWWKTSALDERIHVRFDATGFRTAKASAWTINGHALSAASGTITLSVTVQGFSGKEPHEYPASVVLGYAVTSNGLDITVTGVTGGFPITVGCAITDADVTGNVLSQPTARPSVLIGVRGAVVEIDPSYTRQFEGCLKVFLRRYQEMYNPTRRPRPGDPPPFDIELIRQRLRVQTPQEEWDRVRRVADGITAAFAMLEHDEAREYSMSLLQGLPTLSSPFTIEELEGGFVPLKVHSVEQDGMTEPRAD
ncbi:hypothetical protein [Agromyces sp. NPDC058126]|uniref:hypothetical protein n=1 Tax=Agromyces sp. NPDC058126 TaxID=3346350 RepID=UPI0036DA672E